LKDKIITGLIILNVLLLSGMLIAGSKSRQVKIARDKEMNIRFDAQADLYNTQKENSFLQDKLRKAEDAAKSVNTGLAAAQKALAQEQQINQDLRAELEKISGLKDSLEAELKNMNNGKPGRGSKK